MKKIFVASSILFFNLSLLVEAQDIVPPTLNCPTLQYDCIINNQTLGNYSIIRFLEDGGTFSDNIQIDSSSFQVLDVVSNGNQCPEFITRTLEIRDTSGNATTCTQQIEINDYTPPEFSSIPNNITVDCANNIPPADENILVTDNCGEVTVSFSETVSDSSYANLFTVTRVWIATDDCGNTTQAFQYIQVIDTFPPIFVPAFKDTIIRGIDEMPYPEIEIIENCGLKTSSFVDLLDPANTGTTRVIRIYRAEDDCHNTATFQQKFYISENNFTITSCTTDTTISSCSYNSQVEVEEVFDTWLENSTPEVLAYCDVEMTATYPYKPDICGGTVEVTWHISDTLGNVDSCKASFIVANDNLISVTCPPDTMVNDFNEIPTPYNTLDDFVNSGGVYSTICNSDTIIFNLLYEHLDTTLTPDVLKRTYSILEACGNITICVQVITIEKSTPVREFKKVIFDCNIFPNPTDGVFTIELSGLKSSKVKIYITNMEGQEISEKEFYISGNFLRQSINLHGFAKGAYNLIIQNGENAISKSVILK
ncbi:T9SS type A sorting domain-containing protein [Maribellus comscasis]|uniref:T9SS type A sorting domain-containing protein n=1 Tax=Maribellus comscasis TaxID=2681766 RepID=A0A6I6K0L7_9BACT|nr:T9SS type A sorting domain-containing protein [Maribellus comscasis]QGY47139.1 T9SS type A sorting domain-containing protein [Maribellus comscasis]